jgi:hypothetical protein
MSRKTFYLPNGEAFTTKPVFGGINFTCSDSKRSSFLAPGWTVVISTKRRRDDEDMPSDDDDHYFQDVFTKPTLNDDSFYISSIVNPLNQSTSREVAEMVWITLLWYFQLPEPDRRIASKASVKTPWPGKPKGDWGIHIKRDGIFNGRNMLQKLERMGLIASEDPSVGSEAFEMRDPSSWTKMFVSRRSFWQVDPRFFLLTIPINASFTSENNSPSFEGSGEGAGEVSLSNATGGPLITTSHLPTYYPAPPTQYTFTNGIRHPLRPIPPHQGEVFYTRYVPSVQRYLSFRVPLIPSTKPQKTSSPSSQFDTPCTSIEKQFENTPSDRDFLFDWMKDMSSDSIRGEADDPSQQEEYLRPNFRSRHRFPILGYWDGKPYAFFEMYWVKEDELGQLLDGVANYDRGIHLVVEKKQEQTSPHRMAIYLSALVHYCLLADTRTEAVIMEQRVDNVE